MSTVRDRFQLLDKSRIPRDVDDTVGQLAFLVGLESWLDI
jgi:hypothetical protein